MDVVMPASAWEGIDESAEALLDQWLVHEGDLVHQGQTLARVVLIKSTLDVQAPADGRLIRILVETGSRFRREQPLAIVEGSP